MRLSQLFSRTLREAPAEAEAASHQLLVRAGYISQLGAGVFSYLPLAQRAMQKIAAIMRQEIEAIGGQEILMPLIHPAEVWQETGRWHEVAAEPGRFRDRSGRDMVLATRHEEVIADLVRREVRSYRQLPRLLYHLQLKWRDELRPRGGLLRAREFTMLDSYSLDADPAGLDRQYRAHYQAYFNIFARSGLPVIAAQSDVGIVGGSRAHEFTYLTPVGEDTLLLCDSCGYSANRQIARMQKPALPAEALRPLKKVATPGAATIDELARYLEIPRARTAKAVFFSADLAEAREAGECLVFAVVRGDMDLNETKLARAIGARSLRPATVDEIRATGAVPGYASPIGNRGAMVVVDEIVPASPNLVAGANEEGYHLLHVNYGRDFTASVVADIAAAGEGSGCPRCGRAMRASRGVEVGKMLKLGTAYSDRLGCTFLDAQGAARPVVMGSYGIGLGRLLACVAEEHHDEAGLAWPISVAPYAVHQLALGDPGEASHEVAETLYRTLRAENVEVLYDDREESPGVKFADADLLGVPLRVAVGKRSLAGGGVELRLRGARETRVVPLESAAAEIRASIAALERDLAGRLGSMPSSMEEAAA